MKSYLFVGCVSLFAGLAVPGAAQSDAALAQLLAHHSPETVDDMRANAHYRYVGELLFYEASFVVEDVDGFRAPTEAEVAGIDLHAHDGLRLVDERVGVFDTNIGKRIHLLSRSEFEQLVLGRLNETDRADYLGRKEALMERSEQKVR